MEIETKKQKIIKYTLLSIYILLVIVFYIFTLSSGAKSAKESSFVTDVLLWFLRLITFRKVEFDYDVLHRITRKLVGHYGYNLLLGLMGTITIYSFKGLGKITLIICGALGLFIAVSGELLQFIPANRGPSFVDMLINFAGEVTGILLSVLIILVIERRKKTISE